MKEQTKQIYCLILHTLLNREPPGTGYCCHFEIEWDKIGVV